jgi:hypothetical protein
VVSYCKRIFLFFFVFFSWGWEEGLDSCKSFLFRKGNHNRKRGVWHQWVVNKGRIQHFVGLRFVHELMVLLTNNPSSLPPSKEQNSIHIELPTNRALVKQGSKWPSWHENFTHGSNADSTAFLRHMSGSN